MKLRSTFAWFLFGVLIGYFVMHPIFIGLGHLMHTYSMYTEHSFWAILKQSYSFHTFPWSLGISLFCGLIGYLLSKIRIDKNLLKNAKLDLEKKIKERTSELLEANQKITDEVVERTNAQTELIERARQAELGAEIGSILVLNRDLETILQLCTKAIVKHLDAAFARIWVLNEKGNILELIASAGMYTHIDGNHRLIPLGKLKIGMIGQEKRPHLTNKVIGDPRISDQEWAKREGMVAFTGHPLVVGEKLMGVMGMFSKKALPNSALTALGSIADGIALGIERKKSEDQIRFLAFYDSLTGLPNRNYFNELLEKTIEYSNRYKEQFFIILIDLDNFNRINDTLGHYVGDECLKIVSSRLLNTLRNSDCIARIFDKKNPVARMGGDEFILLLREVDSVKKANTVLLRVLNELTKPYQFDGNALFITASIGVASYPEDGNTAENLFKNVDTALFYAKKKGKNNFQFYSKSMNDKARERLTLETNLRRAIERQEFLLYYQPKVDIASRRIIGMEALIRWKLPTGELIPPGKFIPLAEETGLIVPISEIVMEIACFQNQIWQQTGMEKISVAVNISGLHFGKENFVPDVLTVLSKTALDPKYFELEITETAIMLDSERATNNLNQLKEAGIQISLDDFGTGYSSLSYLQRLPIDAMKIDISFIRDVVSNPNNAMIVKTIISMAHNMNLRVIAEGVEDKDQLEFLAEHNCDIVQGYLFSPPVPAEEFSNLLLNGIAPISL